MADTPVPIVREFFMVEGNPRVHGKTRGPEIQRKAPSILCSICLKGYAGVCSVPLLIPHESAQRIIY